MIRVTDISHCNWHIHSLFGICNPVLFVTKLTYCFLYQHMFFFSSSESVTDLCMYIHTHTHRKITLTSEDTLCRNQQCNQFSFVPDYLFLSVYLIKSSETVYAFCKVQSVFSVCFIIKYHTKSSWLSVYFYCFSKWLNFCMKPVLADECLCDDSLWKGYFLCYLCTLIWNRQM